MGSLQQQQQQQSPAKGRYRYSPLAGNLLPSLSGSETDVSTSNENLSNEEKYVIRHTARQEPQGQENQHQQHGSNSNRSSLRDSLQSNRSSLDVSSSSYNTLIIHSAGDEPWTGRNSGTRESSDNTPQYAAANTNPSYFHDPKLSPLQKRSSPSTSANLETKRNSYDYQDIPDIPDDYLSQSSVLKHLAKEVNTNEMSAFDAAPSDWSDKSPLRKAAVVHRHKQAVNSADKSTMSKSQPDLSKVGVAKAVEAGFRRGVSAPRPPTKGHEVGGNGGELWPSAEMVEILIKENSALKMELDNCYRRVAKTQKLEQEILKVHKAQEELVQSCERKERLERAARGRLQNDNRRMQELNRALREQVDLLTNQMMSSRSPMSNESANSQTTDSLRRELGKREVLIAQLIQQNKELVAVKERQEIELAAQRVTLQEQRTHIDILDTALTNAQGNVVRLEEECRKKQSYVERVAQLQRALSSLQLASDRREHTERKLRLQLERELQRTKMAAAAAHGHDGAGGDVGGGGVSVAGGGDSPNAANETKSELKRQLREKEEKIMQLEGDCTKWEQRYLEESALRQAAIDAASIPKDAKIAALEKTSQETEKIIAEARNDKIRHMDEAHAAQKKVADLESRTKDLESKLAEKDAMIRVLQKHHSAADVMLRGSPHHTPHPSLVGGGHGDVIDHVLAGTGVSREELVSSVLTSSTGFGSGNSYAGSDSSFHHHHHHVMPSYGKYGDNKTTGNSFIDSSNLLDNQLKEIDSQLDSQLLSKDSLIQSLRREKEKYPSHYWRV